MNRRQALKAMVGAIAAPMPPSLPRLDDTYVIWLNTPIVYQDLDMEAFGQMNHFDFERWLEARLAEVIRLNTHLV
jgi:hypothetical protein